MRRTRVGFRPGISRTVEGCIVISGDMTSLELGVVAPVGGIEACRRAHGWLWITGIRRSQWPVNGPSVAHGWLSGCRAAIPTRLQRGAGGSRVDLRGGDLGPFVCVGPRVQRVEHGQLRVVDDVDGVVEGIGCILLGPIRVRCRGLGVQLIGPLVDLCLDVLSSGNQTLTVQCAFAAPP